MLIDLYVFSVKMDTAFSLPNFPSQSRFVVWRLLQLPLLKSFDRKFRMLLTLLGFFKRTMLTVQELAGCGVMRLYCERHAFFPDQHIVKEGEALKAVQTTKMFSCYFPLEDVDAMDIWENVSIFIEFLHSLKLT